MESLFGTSNQPNLPNLSHVSANEPPLAQEGAGPSGPQDNDSQHDIFHDSDDDNFAGVDDRNGRGGRNESPLDAEERDNGVTNLSNVNVDSGADGPMGRSARRAASGSSQASRRVRPRSDARGRAVSSMIFSNAFGLDNVASCEMHDEDGEVGDDEEEDAEDVDEFDNEEHAEGADQQEIEQSLFRVAGVTCVGCALDPSRLAKVDQFVVGNAATKQSDALWRLAEAVYQTSVVKPCRRERSVAPVWTWQEIRSHYLEHVVSDKLVRLQTCREMGAMRRILVSQMVAVNDETGAQELDKGILDQYLKVVTTESREHALLTSAENAQQKAAATSNSRYGSSIVPTNNTPNDEL